MIRRWLMDKQRRRSSWTGCGIGIATHDYTHANRRHHDACRRRHAFDNMGDTMKEKEEGSRKGGK